MMRPFGLALLQERQCREVYSAFPRLFQRSYNQLLRPTSDRYIISNSYHPQVVSFLREPLCYSSLSSVLYGPSKSSSPSPTSACTLSRANLSQAIPLAHTSSMSRPQTPSKIYITTGNKSTERNCPHRRHGSLHAGGGHRLRLKYHTNGRQSRATPCLLHVCAHRLLLGASLPSVTPEHGNVVLHRDNEVSASQTVILITWRCPIIPIQMLESSIAITRSIAAHLLRASTFQTPQLARRVGTTVGFHAERARRGRRPHLGLYHGIVHAPVV